MFVRGSDLCFDVQVNIQLQPVWPVKNRKCLQNDFTRKIEDFATFLPKNVGDLGKLIVA